MDDQADGIDGASHVPVDDPSATQRLSGELVRHIAQGCDLSHGDLLALDQQLSRATVTGSKATMIDVEIPSDAPQVTVLDGPLPISAYVVNQSGQAVGEVLVWMKSGTLQGAEQAWWTDQPPSAWPSLDQVQLR